jgi:hypothetical protein
VLPIVTVDVCAPTFISDNPEENSAMATSEATLMVTSVFCFSNDVPRLAGKL